MDDAAARIDLRSNGLEMMKLLHSSFVGARVGRVGRAVGRVGRFGSFCLGWISRWLVFGFAFWVILRWLGFELAGFWFRGFFTVVTDAIMNLEKSCSRAWTLAPSYYTIYQAGLEGRRGSLPSQWPIGEPPAVKKKVIMAIRVLLYVVGIQSLQM